MSQSRTLHKQSALNALCKVGEHEWRSTAAPNYRICNRIGCHAAQQKRGEIWVEVQSVQSVLPVAQEPSPQMPMWGAE